jgi:succinate-semialdehyde dehydrogenase/glutarate-semialdehyde dehydrogenase
MIYDAFYPFIAAKMGEPTDETSYYGPMARVDLRDELHEQVLKTVAQGGKLILGGYIPDQNGAYYPATILADLQEWKVLIMLFVQWHL